MNNPDQFPPRLPMQRATGQQPHQQPAHTDHAQLKALEAKFEQIRRLLWLQAYLYRNRN